MKVLYFMNHVDQGGAALALYDLIVELKRNYKGFYPIVITGKQNELNKMFDEIKVENYSADYKNFMSSYQEPFSIIKTGLLIRYKLGNRIGIRQIEEIIDFSSIDVIHSNLNRIDIGAILAARHGIPHLWHIREHAAIYTGIIKPHLATSRSEMSGFDLISVKENPIKYMSDFDLISVKENRFIAISESVRSEWVRKGLPEDKIILVHDGVREELYNGVYRKERKAFDKKVRMIFLGGYCKEKGQEEFLMALLKLTPDDLSMIHVDFFGNGEQNYIERVKVIAKPLLDRGVISINAYDPQISSKLSNYDIGVNCSNAEGFGRVTVEYMMAGLCPLVSNTGASPEIVKHNINGLLYKKGDLQNLCDNLHLIIENIETIRDLGTNARECSLRNFSMKMHAKNIYNNYLSITG